MLDARKKCVRISVIRNFRRGYILLRVVLKDRGQVTIPAKLRKTLMLRSGDLLEIEVRGGYIILKPLQVVEREGDRPENSVEGPAA